MKRSKPDRAKPLTSFNAGGILVDVEASLNIVIRSPRVNGPDVTIDVPNLELLRRALDRAEQRRNIEDDERRLRWA